MKELLNDLTNSAFDIRRTWTWLIVSLSKNLSFLFFWHCIYERTSEHVWKKPFTFLTSHVVCTIKKCSFRNWFSMIWSSDRITWLQFPNQLMIWKRKNNTTLLPKTDLNLTSLHTCRQQASASNLGFRRSETLGHHGLSSHSSFKIRNFKDFRSFFDIHV